MTFILIIHSFVCVLLLLAILMQAGRGGGLTEQFASAESVFGAQTNVFMVRLTSTLATIFFITCLSLAFMSARQERSLMAGKAPVKKTSASMVIPPANAQKVTDQLNATMPDAKEVETAPAVEPKAAAATDAQTPVTTNAQ